MIFTLLNYWYRQALWILSSWSFSWRSKVQVQPQGDAAAHGLLPAASDGGKGTEKHRPSIILCMHFIVIQVS